MTPLDQAHRLASPPTWTAERVKDRLVEAYAIEKRMPGQRVASIKSVWPASPMRTFADLVGSNERERVWERWGRATGVYAFEVTRMEESFAWCEHLPDGERRCLKAWALASSRGLSVRAMLDRRHWSRTTFYRRVDGGAARIADRLNRQGVQVR